jgi:hypothetical protein
VRSAVRPRVASIFFLLSPVVLSGALNHLLSNAWGQSTDDIDRGYTKKVEDHSQVYIPFPRSKPSLTSFVRPSRIQDAGTHFHASVGSRNQLGRKWYGVVIKCMLSPLLCPSVSPDNLLPVQAPPPISSILLFAPYTILFTHISQLVQVQNSQWNRPSVLRLTSFSAYCESRSRRSRKGRWDFCW